MGKTAAIVLVVIILIVVGIFLGAYAFRTNHTDEMIKKGCEPKAFDRNGIPTLWACPPGVE